MAKDFPPAVDIQTLPESDVEDPNSTTGSPSFSCSENVKSPRILCNKQTDQAVVSAVSAGWLNPAARPYFRPSSVHFNNMYWPNAYDPMYMTKGRWGTAVKTSAGYSWRNKRSQSLGHKGWILVQINDIDKGGFVKVGGGDVEYHGKEEFPIADESKVVTQNFLGNMDSLHIPHSDCSRKTKGYLFSCQSILDESTRWAQKGWAQVKLHYNQQSLLRKVWLMGTPKVFTKAHRLVLLQQRKAT
ncbi:hypothetical protein Tco_1254698 [Tanacetum coccineum]